MKKTKGFSYVEVIIAMALFAIALLAIIPALSQAGRNMQFAQEAYAGHLQAQRIMLDVRNALMEDDADLKAAVARYAASGFEFSIWVFGRGAQEIHSIGAPDADATVAGINIAMPNYASTIVVIVWNEDDRVAGRAIGMIYL